MSTKRPNTFSRGDAYEGEPLRPVGGYDWSGHRPKAPPGDFSGASPAAAPKRRPTLGEHAFHGAAGELVRLLEPHTEADVAGLLVQTLAGFGNMAGRHAYFEVEGDRHHGNEYVVLVGPTAKGRKGTSWGRILGLLTLADPGWAANHLLSGLATGEGLIHHPRDTDTGGAGHADKRALVVEPEYAKVLKRVGRQGNIISPTLRDAWDSGTLGVLTKATPARATGTHVGLIGHITAAELRRELTATETANGFANRHLFVWVERSKLLPEGGSPDPEELRPFADRLRQAARFAQADRRIERDAATREFWRMEYPRLSADRVGLVGALTARAEAHATRLSLIYALLDRSKIIRPAHLKAALAVWQYAYDTVSHVFGDVTVDPLADDLLERLRQAPGGLSRTELSNLLGRNQSAARIEAALALLLQSGLARGQQVPTGGRAAERWFVTVGP